MIFEKTAVVENSLPVMTARRGLMGCANKAQVTHWSVLPVISQVLDSATHFDGLNVPSGKRTSYECISGPISDSRPGWLKDTSIEAGATRAAKCVSPRRSYQGGTYGKKAALRQGEDEVSEERQQLI